MEAVGLAASIIALLGVAKKLADIVGSGSAESNVLIKRIVLDLTAVHECLQHCDSVDGCQCQELREACVDLESSLTACLAACRTHLSESRLHRFKALLRGRTKADLVRHLKRIELDVSALLLRFLMKGLVRTEVTATNALCLNKQFRDEVCLRLDAIESELKQQTVHDSKTTTLLGPASDGTANGFSVKVKVLPKSYDLRSEIRRLRLALQEFPPMEQKGKGHDDQWESDDELEEETHSWTNQELAALPVRYR